MKHKAPFKPGERDAALATLRNRKMATSVHAYVRGTPKHFYAWLGSCADRFRLPNGPSIWICGDCHTGNLGPLASTDGKVAVQLRDFDQTTIGNPAHDLLRLALSLAMEARGSDLPGVTTARMMEKMISAYEAAFEPRLLWKADDHAMPRTIAKLLARAEKRSWTDLADEWIDGRATSIPLGKRFWPLSKQEHDEVDALLSDQMMQQLARCATTAQREAAVSVIDAAYWRKGLSSMGELRLAVLVAIETGKEPALCLMDIKEAVTAAAPRDPAASMPRDNGERVVTGARSLSPYLGDRMVAGRFLDRAVFVRELLPQDLKLDIEHLGSGDAAEIAGYLANILGRAHARQMDDLTRRRWLSELRRNHTKSLDAPTWLWKCVVDLAQIHEAAYLEHCRFFALQHAN